jgi:UDP-N-acetylmuramyl pentapeptide synthase
MSRLGRSKYAQEQYVEVGKKVIAAGVDILIIIGEDSKKIGRTAVKLGMNENNVYYANNQNDVDKYINPYLRKDTIILLKSDEERVEL